MNSSATPARSGSWAVLTLAFRPFFLAASLWAVIALAIWMAMFTTGWVLPSRFDPLSWHIHEMLFGFVLAAIAGFLLTAIPTWTGRAPVRGTPLAWLATLWLLGRIACSISALIPFWLAAATDLSFACALAMIAVREILAARNWRNVAMPAPVIVLGIANLMMYLEQAGFAVIPGTGWRLALAAVIILISVVGGRIIPSFTRNWLMKRADAVPPGANGLVDRAALAALHGGLVGWAFLPQYRAFGVLLILGAALNLWRLSRWRGLATLDEPLLAILHIGYLWVIVGAALLGATVLSKAVPVSAAVHALTAGAIGTMILAVMTRVARGHTGRALTAGRLTSLIYLLINAAALARIAAAVFGAFSWQLLGVSAALWVSGFALFAAIYGPMLLAPTSIPRPSQGAR